MRYLFTIIIMIASISASLMLSAYAFSSEESDKLNQTPTTQAPTQTAPLTNVPQTSSQEPVVGKHAGVNTNALTMILTLLMVLVLIIVCAMLLKRFQPAHIQSKGLKVVTSLSLGAKERLIVVQVGDKQQLLGVTSQQINLLDTLDSPIIPNNDMTTELSKSIVSIFQKHVAKKPVQEQNSNINANKITPLKKEPAQHEE